MRRSWGPGPVFAFECLTASRRPRTYATRALFVCLLMIGLAWIWAPPGQAIRDPGELARIATRFFVAVVSIQLAVVSLAAPATTAGAVCVDKGRGTLQHAFVTDLSAREIILGKFASHLASVLALLTCGLPVLALSGLLGGIDLRAAFGAYLVTLGVAVLGSALALTFSVWARWPHQALLPTYALLGTWAGAFPASLLFGIGPPPTWSPASWVAALTNPIFCAFAPYLDPARDMLGTQVAFLGVTVLIALMLVDLAARLVRPVVLGQASRPASRGRPGLPARLLALLPGPPLDGNPVLWREWQRKHPTRWTGRLWTAYAALSALASSWAIATYFLAPGRRSSGEMAGLVSGCEVAIGLLLLSISAPLALGEERDRGSLDVIMATPLPTRTIVWGKWWGTFATVPRLAILPIWVAAALAMVTGRWSSVALTMGMIFAPAAALTSLGLAQATWNPRPGRAVAGSVLAYVMMTVGWSVFVMALGGLNPYGSGSGSGARPGQYRGWETLTLANPFFGVSWATADTGNLHIMDHVAPGFWDDPRHAGFDHAPGWPLFWIGFHLAVAAVLLAATLMTFDRYLGRIPERRDGPAAPRHGMPDAQVRRAPGAGEPQPSRAAKPW